MQVRTAVILLLVVKKEHLLSIYILYISKFVFIFTSMFTIIFSFTFSLTLILTITLTSILYHFYYIRDELSTKITGEDRRELMELQYQVRNKRKKEID